MSRPTSPALSVVIPCYNEAACLAVLHARVTAAARAAVGNDYEILLINDGSRDDSWGEMQRLAADDPRLVIVNLSRNHGHQLALTAGLDLCSGAQILIIDADLQDPPELLTDMRAAMAAQGADVVYAVRRKREGETLFKKATAAAFYRLLDRVTDTAIPLEAVGIGSVVTCDEADAEGNVAFGNQFNGRAFSREIVLHNAGRRQQQLVWVNSKTEKKPKGSRSASPAAAAAADGAGAMPSQPGSTMSAGSKVRRYKLNMC